MELYNSRLTELNEEFGEYTRDNAIADDARYLKGQAIDYMQELGYYDRKRIHNLKYYTWVEQQGRTYEEIMDQWYDPDYWTEIQSQGPEIDALIEEFNHKAGVKL
ncbi:MAG: hypothetical protein GX773_02505 [Chloroflexi bacterium]|nr:hypothetical protein [Chloroflexota bacterium]